MKINPTGVPNYISGKQRSKYIDFEASPLSSFPTDDAISLSEDAMSFAKVLAAARETYSANAAGSAERVSSLREQIAAGTYRIDSETIAGSIIGELYG